MCPVLEGIVNMAQDNLLAVVSVAVAIAVGVFVLWGPNSARQKRKRGKVLGLTNLGHTCFLNTLLQALAPCHGFRDWLMLHQHTRAANLITSLHSVIQVINGSVPEADDPYTPREVIGALVKRQWIISPGEQDAHELFLVIMNTLEEEIRVLSSNCSLSDALEDVVIEEDHGIKIIVSCNGDCTKSKIFPRTCVSPRMCSSNNDETCRFPSRSMLPFQGFLTSQLMCTVCGYKSSLHYDKFDTLPLTLPSSSFAWKSIGLLNLLENFVSTEIVTDTKCEKCSETGCSSTSAFKCLNFGKLPPCLCIHLSRLVWQNSGHPWKRQDHVDFPEFLSMDPYTHTFIQKTQKSYKNLHPVNSSGDSIHAVNSSGDTEPNVIRNSVENSTSSSNNLRLKYFYQLMAVIVHTGDASSGHFLTYRRAGPRWKSWYYTSDAEVRPCSFEEVKNSNAYMLFYNRLPTII